jgi:hypothetical protein
MDRQRVIDAFVDELAAATHPDEPERAAAMKRWLPAKLPPAPTAQQVDAWVELGELAADPVLRQCLRAIEDEPPGDIPHEPILQRVRTAVEAGVDPASAQGRQIAAAVAGDLPPERWAELAEQVERCSDARFERYWVLLMILNGRPAYSAAPLFDWCVAALRAAHGVRD